jgi:hypothetical protein
MRKAAGIIMLAFGIFAIVGGLHIILQWESGGSPQVWVRLAIAVWLVAAGIGVLRSKAYWWALLAAIAMIIEGIYSAVWAWQDPVFRHYDTATRLLMAVSGSGLWGIPGILVLVFLLRRKDEFRDSPTRDYVN